MWRSPRCLRSGTCRSPGPTTSRSPSDRLSSAVQPTQLRSLVVSRTCSATDPDEQIFRIRPNRVLVSSTFTTLEWTIWSVTGGAGLDPASSPPFAEPDIAGVEPADPVTASGPVLVVATGQGERTLRTRLVRSDVADSQTLECLCSPLQGWTSVLHRPDKPVTVVTTYPPLPAGTERAQVRFGGLGAISVPVTPASDARRRAAGERPWWQTTWRPRDVRSGPGWASANWPTPVPSADDLTDVGARPYALVR